MSASQHTRHDNAQDLSELVRTTLDRSPYFTAKKLRIETRSGYVVLRGTVPSYYQKQMAQESLRGLEGVHHVFNELRVANESD